MDSKTVKLKTHPRNFCGKVGEFGGAKMCWWAPFRILSVAHTEEELIVNIDVLSKEKLRLEAGDIISVSASAVEGNESRYM